MLIVFHGKRWHLESEGLLMLERAAFVGELPVGSGKFKDCFLRQWITGMCKTCFVFLFCVCVCVIPFDCVCIKIKQIYVVFFIA